MVAAISLLFLQENRGRKSQLKKQSDKDWQAFSLKNRKKVETIEWKRAEKMRAPAAAVSQPIQKERDQRPQPKYKVPRITKSESGREIVAGEMLATFTSKTTESEVKALADRYNLILKSYNQSTQTAHFGISSEEPMPLLELKRKLKAENDFVTYTGYNRIFKIRSLPNEFNDAVQFPWYIYNDGTFSCELPDFVQGGTEIIQGHQFYDIAGGRYFDKLYNEDNPPAPPAKNVIIAIVDSAFDIHDEYKQNLWVNPNEIAGNNFDDDGNGIIDDVHGAKFIPVGAGFGVRKEGSPVSFLDARYAFEDFVVDVIDSQGNLTGQTRVLNFVQYIKEINDHIEQLLRQRLKLLSDLNTQPLSPKERVEKLKELADVNFSIYSVKGLVEEAYANTHHGTWIAGIIGGRANNDQGTVGVLRNAQMMVVSAQGVLDNGRGGLSFALTDATLLDGLNYAIDHGADILSLSWGGPYEDDDPNTDFGDPQSLTDCEGTVTITDDVPASCTFYNVFKVAADRGILTLVSAGNSSEDVDAPASYYEPTSLAQVPRMNMIAVGATDADDTESSFTSYSGRFHSRLVGWTRSVQIGAPGSCILSTNFSSDTAARFQNAYQAKFGVVEGYDDLLRHRDSQTIDPLPLYTREAQIDGTSFSTPIVAAAAAAIKSVLKTRGANSSAAEVKRILLQFANRNGALNDFFEEGRTLNLFKSLEEAYGGNFPTYASSAPTGTGGTAPVLGGGTVSATADSEGGGGGGGGCGAITTLGGGGPGGGSAGNHWPIFYLYVLAIVLWIRKHVRLHRVTQRK